VYSLNPVEGFRPPTLTGHKDTPVAVFFAGAHVRCHCNARIVNQLLHTHFTTAMACTMCEAATGSSLGCGLCHAPIAGEHVAEAARLEGKQPPALYSLARDGALHSYVFLPDVQSAAAAAHPAGGMADSMQADDDAEQTVPAARPAFTGQFHVVLTARRMCSACGAGFVRQPAVTVCST
jgi:hypothetical protein